MQILVVENDAQMAHALVRQLRLQGCTADAVAGYEEVARWLEAGASVDAILSDWDLGRDRPSGVDVLKLAQERCPGALRVLMSGATYDEGDEAVTFFLQKPFSTLQVRSALRLA